MRPIAVAFAIAFSVVSCSICLGATYVVDQGGGGDALTIGGGLALAGSGDSVLVMPGTYFENITIPSGVSLLSSAGWGATRIEPANDAVPIVTCNNAASGTLLRGFAVENGGAMFGAGVYCSNSALDIIQNRIAYNEAGDDGGGVALYNCGTSEIRGNIFHGNDTYERGGALLCDNSSPLVSDNVFTHNGAHFGAGICCVNGAAPEITGNDFVENFARKWGGGVSCMWSCSPVITYNKFESDTALGYNMYGFEVGAGGGVYCWNACDVQALHNTFSNCFGWHGGAMGTSNHCTGLVEDNTFSNCTGEYGAAYYNHRFSDPEIVGNRFENNNSTKWGGAICYRDTARGAARYNMIFHNSAIGGGGIKVWGSSEADIEGNVFWDNSASYGGAVSVSNMCVASIRSNTFFAHSGLVAGGTVDSHNGSNVDIRNCIVAHSSGTAALYAWEGGLMVSDCNDFYANSSDFYGCAAGPSDFFMDPMLCDPAAGNFYIDCQSPCNGYPGCGPVGALGVGCGSTRAEPTTWGAIKATYR